MPALLRGAEVRQAYTKMGLSRRKFAELVEIEPRTLTNITTDGPSQTRCSEATAHRIAYALGWTYDQVVKESDVAQAGAA